MREQHARVRHPFFFARLDGGGARFSGVHCFFSLLFVLVVPAFGSTSFSFRLLSKVNVCNLALLLSSSTHSLVKIALYLGLPVYRLGSCMLYGFGCRVARVKCKLQACCYVVLLLAR